MTLECRPGIRDPASGERCVAWWPQATFPGGSPESARRRARDRVDGNACLCQSSGRVEGSRASSTPSLRAAAPYPSASESSSRSKGSFSSFECCRATVHAAIDQGLHPEHNCTQGDTTKPLFHKGFSPAATPRPRLGPSGRRFNPVSPTQEKPWSSTSPSGESGMALGRPIAVIRQD